MSNPEVRRLANRVAKALKESARSSRSAQLPQSSVLTPAGDLPIAGSVEAAIDTADNVGALTEYTVGVGDTADTGAATTATVPDWIATTDLGIDSTFEVAVIANSKVDEAKADAEEAAQDAANALTIASGKNARRRGVTEPTPPEGGWTQGDQWVRDVLDEDDNPVPVEVLVWNGAEFVHESTLTGELLVIGPNGVIRLADGSVTANSIAADAIDGKTITGAIVRTAESGQRIQMDSVGLRSFSDAEEVTASLTSASGGLQLSGPLVSSAGGYEARYSSGSMTFRRVDGALTESMNVSANAISSMDSNNSLTIAKYNSSPGVGLDLLAGANPASSAAIALRGMSGNPEILFTANNIRFSGSAHIPGVPFKMATGTITVAHASNVPAYAGVVVTLPPGRFTVPPIPFANLFTGTGGAQKDVPRAYLTTTTTLTLGVWAGDNVGTGVAHTDVISWTAIQMTEGSASG